ncbi:hypothetical protein Leryth_018641, partial [Lithospermum erythrorhizon]
FKSKLGEWRLCRRRCLEGSIPGGGIATLAPKTPTIICYYRALAERYDHATVVIRQAHRTMSEAFPNQDPSSHFDDPSSNSEFGDDPGTPENDDQHKAGVERSSGDIHDRKINGAHTEDFDFTRRRKDYSKLVDSKVRKSLNFHNLGEKEQNSRSIGEQTVAGVGQVKELKEIETLRKALRELETEKEAGLVQYQQSLHKLSILESDISRAQEDYRVLGERASTAEAEYQKLTEALSKVKAEKDANLMEYHECLDKVSCLEKIISQAELDTGILNERASKAENEAQSLRSELKKITSEKNAALDQYVLALERISNFENRLVLAEEHAKKLSEQAEKTEIQIETLKQEISKLNEENEAAVIQYQQCLHLISSLEKKLSSAEKEIQQLREEVDSGVDKLKGAEEQQLVLERSNQSLKADMDSLTFKVGVQGQELIERQKEIGSLRSSLQEECFRLVELRLALKSIAALHLLNRTADQLGILAQLLEKNSFLENSLSDLRVELDTARCKIKDLEESCQSLFQEKSQVIDEKAYLLTSFSPE